VETGLWVGKESLEQKKSRFEGENWKKKKVGTKKFPFKGKQEVIEKTTEKGKERKWGGGTN